MKKDNDNRPYINVEFYRQKVLALVDTGSTSSVLGSKGFYLLQKCNIPIHYENSCNITTADGAVQNLLGYINVDLVVSKVSRRMKILVVPSVAHTLILGMDFLEIFQIEANFRTLSYQILEPSLCVVNNIESYADLSCSQKESLQSVIDCFSSIAPENKLGRTHLISHAIDTGNAKPISQRQYPLSPAMQQHLNQEIDKMLELGIIQKSQSPWCSPLWLVPKSSGEYRVCFDGRKLNSVTVKDTYPMPQIDSILNKLRDARYLTSIDLRQAFFQIPLEESSRPKTAFAVYGKGLFEFCVMPFGLANSPKTMVRLMDIVLDPAIINQVFVFLDDIIVASPDFSSHIKTLKEVYQRLKDAGLTVNLKKCEFCRPSLKFLGFVVDNNGLRTDPDKVSAIVNYPTPKNTTEIKRLIGLVSWYRRFIKDFSSISSPINDLLHGRKKGQPIVWTEEAEKAFSEIKLRLTSAPVLASPDFSKPFVIQCDASDTGVGAVLYQECDGLEHPVAYASKSLTAVQRKYTTTEKELLACIFGIEKFRSYVEGTSFVVETDHSSLKWLNSMTNPSGRLTRWAVKLSQFDFTIKHRKGSLNVVADALSRSVAEVSVLDVATFKPDRWYTKMIEKVQSSPEAYPTFRVENGILYKHIFPKHNIVSNLSSWKIVVPTVNRPEILRLYHDEPTGAHFGVAKTLSRVCELYYWPGMRKTVYAYVRKCTICASCKSSNLPRAGLMGAYKNINFPFQLVSADLLGPYPRSKNGNQYILVVVDWFTKFVLVHPMSRATSAGIVKFIENNVFLIFGVPQIFACDNGSQFVSKEFKKLMDDYKVQKIWFNPRYHAQINHAERANKVIVTAIRCYIHENHNTWDREIFKIAQAIRITKHDVTGYSPAFLNFARNVPVSGDFYGKIENNSENVISISEKSQLINDIQELPELFIEVRKRLYQAYQRNAKYYNLRKRSVKYHVGDKLWKRNFTLSSAPNKYSAKLAPKYIPCIVTKVLSKLVYEVQDMDGNNLGNYHVKDLKQNFSRNESESSSVSEDEDSN